MSDTQLFCKWKLRNVNKTVAAVFTFGFNSHLKQMWMHLAISRCSAILQATVWGSGEEACSSDLSRSVTKCRFVEMSVGRDTAQSISNSTVLLDFINLLISTLKNLHSDQIFAVFHLLKGQSRQDTSLAVNILVNSDTNICILLKPQDYLGHRRQVSASYLLWDKENCALAFAFQLLDSFGNSSFLLEK